MQIKHRELHRIAVTAIIYRQAGNGQGFEYLIVKRSPDKKAFPGIWTVPGGGLEVDDYINLPKTTDVSWYYVLDACVRREVKEEVGLDVGKVKYLLDIAFIKPDGTPVIVLSYYCDFKSGEVKLNEENVDYKWVCLEEAKNYNLISGILEEIEMVDKILRGANPEGVKFNNH